MEAVAERFTSARRSRGRNANCRYEFDISMCHLILRIHFGGVCIDNAAILAFGSRYCLSKVYMIVIGFWQTRKRNARKSRHLF